MALTRTSDPTLRIEERRPGQVIYRADNGERWVITGTCSQCGACWQGAVGNPSVDPARPVRPEIKDNFPQCTLRGHYLPPVGK